MTVSNAREAVHRKTGALKAVKIYDKTMIGDQNEFMAKVKL